MLPRQSCRLDRACNDYFDSAHAFGSLFTFWNLEQSSGEKAGIGPTYQTPFQKAVTLVWNSSARRGSTRGGGIRDAGVKVHPVHSVGPKTPRRGYSSPNQEAEIIVPPSIESRPTKGKKCALPYVKVPCGRFDYHPS